MATQKLYAGVKLREIRGRLGLTQKAFADKLSVSLPYLNQMENNHRPVSAAVWRPSLCNAITTGAEADNEMIERVILVQAAERAKASNWVAGAALTVGESERLVTDMREALADPVFTSATPPVADLRLAASNAPALARAFLNLHRA